MLLDHLDGESKADGFVVSCLEASGSGYLITALAFGLSIVAMAYSIGNVSGCHINPAVSLALLMRGRMKSSDFGGYVIAQILGAFVGSA
ncbi:MAG: aquaporin, partial [Bacteroidales bacterium]|nr:aquaporin [Bacteroidales bacterium]